MAPMLTNVEVAPPRNGIGVAVVDVVALEPEVEPLQVLLTSSKLAQARRLHIFQSQHCLSKVGNGVVRKVSGAERPFCSRNMFFEPFSIANQKYYLRNVRT